MLDDTSDTAIKGTVVSVAGRRNGGPRWLPTLSEMTVQHSDGRVVSLALRAEPGSRIRGALYVAPIGAKGFGHCPICFVPDPTSLEHVPQGTLGGAGMTYTCEDCNNRLGSRLEGPLLDWFDGAARVKVSGDGIQGVRQAGRYLRRQASDGADFIVHDRGGDSAVGEILRSGTAAVHMQVPTQRAVRFAAMKHAYLAACLWMGGIPGGDAADQIRGALINVRDQRHMRSLVLPECPPVDGLLVGRVSQNRTPGGRLTLMRSAEEPHQWLLSLAGSIIVSWPLRDHDPVGFLRRVELDGRALDPTSTVRSLNT